MVTCDICGGPEPCANSFCLACKASDAKRAAEKPKTWRYGITTDKDLQTKVFPPVRIIVPGLIPEGVTIVAGKPKIGKSWLALDICAAIAGERFMLGQTKVPPGDT